MVKPPALMGMLQTPLARYLVPGAAVALVLAISYFTPASSPQAINSSLASCSSAGIAVAPLSPHQPSGNVVVTGSATCTSGYGQSGIPSYRFWVLNPGGVWTIRQDYSSSNTFTWNINGLAPGNYGLEVDVRDQSNNTVPYEHVANTTYVISKPALCGTASGLSTLTAAPPGSAATGATVTFSTFTGGCPNPRTRFWIRPPGGNWMIVQDYSPATTYNWNTTGLAAGSYGVEADFRDASDTTLSYEDHVNITYSLGCTAAGLSANPPSPSDPGTSGTTVVLTATSTCPGTAEYRFWMLPPGGAWTVLRDYAPGNVYNWLVAGKPLGMYGLEVDVRDQGSSESYEKVANIPYLLQKVQCTGAGLSAAPPSPGATGGTITLTASSASCPQPQYRFWVGQNGIWTMVQDYSTANTFNWMTPSTGRAGTYGLEVDVRAMGETTSYDVVKNITYVLNGCSAAGLTATPPNTVVHGNGVLLTATSTCPGTAEYRFWVKAPGGQWTIVRDYGAGNAFTYTPATAGTYYFEVDVRDQGGTDVYEKVANINAYTAT